MKPKTILCKFYILPGMEYSSAHYSLQDVRVYYCKFLILYEN